jgi:Flp pilus assembly protein TadG
VHNIHDADIQRTGIFARDTAGTAAIEFAIVAPLLIAIILATLQAALIFLVGAFFESSAIQAARTVLTNNALTNPTNINQMMTPSEFENEICTELTTLFNCSELIVELEPLPPGTTNLASLLPQFSANGEVLSTPPVDVGASAQQAGTDMLLVVMYPWPVYGGPLGLNLANFANNTRLLASTQVFRTEPQ